MSPAATGGLPRTTVGNGGGPVTTSLATNGMETHGLESLRGANRVYPHLSDLVKVKVDVDLQNTPIRTLLHKGEAFAKLADTHLDFKRPDFALQEYVKALTVVTALPRHKDWPTVQADRGDLHRLSTGLNKRVDGQHEKFEAVKKLIQENNLRSGVKPTYQNGSAHISQANTHSRSHSTLSTYTNGSSAPSTDGSHYTVETNGTSRGSTPSITPGNAPVLRKKPAPPIQPKPDALHGKAINSFGNKPANTSQVDLLAARFARLRGSESPVPGQDPRIRTHPISIPDDPGVVSNATADKSQDQAQSPKPMNRPLGPREMPSVPATPFQSSNTRPLINVNIPTMPKAPDAIYSPARGSDTAATINLPSSNPRGSYVRSSSRQNSVSSIPKNYVSTPLSADDGRDYFSPTHAMENYSYKPSKRASQEPLYPPDKLDITAGELVNLLKVSSILLVDIRTRAEFDSGHIMTQRIICVEPMTIRPDMSAEELEESMVLAPDAEQDLFKQRQDFDLIVYYNQSSCHPSAYDSKGTYKTALEDFCKAVYDYGYDKKPARRPILLYGGLDAWMDVIGPASLTSSQTGASSSNTSLRRSIRPAGKVPMARDPRRLVDYRKKAYQSRLRPEEESKWDEVLQENPRSPNPNPDYVTTTDDFFRRFPAINLQESMIAPISDHASRRLDEAHQKELTSMMPPPPARPPPALPRQSFSGVSERTSGGLTTMTTQGTDPSQTSSISKHVVPPGLTGLANFGNTCYMNSVMQCLSATTPIRKFLENYHYPDNRPPRKGNETSDPPQLMIRNVGNLFRYLWSGQYVYVTPSTFKNYVFRLHSNRGTKENQTTFGGPNQQDAHEFLEWSLEIMNDELNPYRNITETGDTEEEEKMRNKQHRLEVAHSWWQKRRSLEGSILTNYLEGAEINEIRCSNCESVSRRNQPFSILTVAIPEHVDKIVLGEQIKKNWDIEHLDDFDCPGCKSTGTSYRKRQICRLPPWLIIQISFFRFGLRGAEKRYIHVDFPKYKGELLDLSTSFIQAGPNDPHIPNLDSGIKGPFKYECYAIVRHSGSSANSGHYRAQVYHEQEKGVKNWYTYDDTRVRQASKSELDTNTLGEPYLLFYKRQTFGMA